jgi:hypothetical protein
MLWAFHQVKLEKSVCKALCATLVIHRPTDTTLRLRAGCPRLSYHLSRKTEESVCEAPGATLAPPSFHAHLVFSLPTLSTGLVCLNRHAKIRPVRTLISIVIVFSRGNNKCYRSSILFGALSREENTRQRARRSTHRKMSQHEKWTSNTLTGWVHEVTRRCGSAPHKVSVGPCTPPTREHRQPPATYA